LASAIGGVLAGLLGGEATDGGLGSMSPIFSYMVKYYLGIAVVLVVLAYFFREQAKESS
jgi:cytochrome c biogenesis protein CcdA